MAELLFDIQRWQAYWKKKSILFKDDKPWNSQGQSNNQSLRQSLTSQPFPLPNCDDLTLETSTLRENLGSQVQSIGWDKAGGQFGIDF